MTLLNFCGIAVSGIMLGLKYGFALQLLQNKSTDFLKIIKNWLNWFVAGIYMGGSVLIIAALSVPMYYLQIIDIILTIAMIAVIDVKRRVIPNRMLVYLVLSQLALVVCTEDATLSLVNIGISAVVFLLLVLLSKMSKEQIGMGDVKFLTCINLIFGLAFVVYSLLLSLLVMLLFIIPRLIMKKSNLKSELPFAPFYGIGLIIYVLGSLFI